MVLELFRCLTLQCKSVAPLVALGAGAGGTGAAGAAAPASAPAGHGTERLEPAPMPNYGVTDGWDNILCYECNRVAGQSKYSHNPGLRDPPSYTMRCFDYYSGTWWRRLPGKRTIQETRMISPTDEIRLWVQANKSCCAAFGSVEDW